MFRVAISIVQDPALAEDVVQDALVRIWLNLGQFRGDAPLKAWVLRITHNSAVSTLRQVRDVAWDPHRLPVSPTAGVEEAVMARHDLVELSERLASLDELSRTILALREGNGMPYNEIAEMLGITVGQVKIRLFRARQHLVPRDSVREGA